MSRTSYRPWRPAEEAEMAQRIAAGQLYPEIAAALGRSAPSVRQKALGLGVNHKAQARGAAPLHLPGVTLARNVRDDMTPESAAVRVDAPAESDEEPIEALLARALRETGRQVAKARTEKLCRLRIASDRPIALSLSSDWHITTTGATDLAGLLAYADAVRAAPHVYAVAVGDLHDNNIKHKPTAVREVKDELRLVDHVVGRFGRKLLAMTDGNHDAWSRAVAGIDNLAALAARRRVHYAPDELIYLVEIVDPADADTVTARWVVATRHKYRRHSNLNYTHACWRWLEEMANDWPTDTEGRTLLPDVLAIGDNHVAAVETRSTERGDVVACRMGAWQRQSGFARGLGFPGSRPTAPTVILAPTRRVQPLAFADYEAALAHLAAAAAAA